MEVGEPAPLLKDGVHPTPPSSINREQSSDKNGVGGEQLSLPPSAALVSPPGPVVPRRNRKGNPAPAAKGGDGIFEEASSAPTRTAPVNIGSTSKAQTPGGVKPLTTPPNTSASVPALGVSSLNAEAVPLFLNKHMMNSNANNTNTNSTKPHDELPTARSADTEPAGPLQQAPLATREDQQQHSTRPSSAETTATHNGGNSASKEGAPEGPQSKPEKRRRGQPPPPPPFLQLPTDEEGARRRRTVTNPLGSPSTPYETEALQSSRSRQEKTPRSPHPGTLPGSPRKRGRPPKSGNKDHGTGFGFSGPSPEQGPSLDAVIAAGLLHQQQKAGKVPLASPRPIDDGGGSGGGGVVGLNVLLAVAATLPRGRGRPPTKIVPAPGATRNPLPHEYDDTRFEGDDEDEGPHQHEEDEHGVAREHATETEGEGETTPKKRPRGRPRKNTIANGFKRGRGRPKKASFVVTAVGEDPGPTHPDQHALPPPPPPPDAANLISSLARLSGDARFLPQLLCVVPGVLPPAILPLFKAQVPPTVGGESKPCEPPPPPPQDKQPEAQLSQSPKGADADKGTDDEMGVEPEPAGLPRAPSASAMQCDDKPSEETVHETEPGRGSAVGNDETH